MCAAASAQADEVRVFAAGAAKQAADALAVAFHQATGHALRAEYDTVGALTRRVLEAKVGAASYSAALTRDTAAAQQLLSFFKNAPSVREFEASGFAQKQDQLLQRLMDRNRDQKRHANVGHCAHCVTPSACLRLLQ